MKSTSLKFKEIIGGSYFPKLGCLAAMLFLVQQSVAALSSLFLVRMTNAISMGTSWKAELCLLLLSVVLPYFPGAVANATVQFWIHAAQEKLWSFMIEFMKGRVELLNTSQAKEAVLGIQKEIFYFIEECLKFFGTFVATGLNFVLNLVVVSTLLGREMMIGLVASFALTIVQILIMSKLTARLAVEKQYAFSEIDRTQLGSWQNLVIGNKYNLDLFEEDWQSARTSFRNSIRKAAIIDNLVSVGLSVVSFVPTIVALVFVSTKSAHDSASLLAVAVLLPRVFLVWNVSANTFLLIQQFPSFRARWNQFSTRFEVLAGLAPLSGRVSASKIQLRDQKLQVPVDTSVIQSADPKDFMSKVPQKGWITVHGTNGAGKSSLLLMIKRFCGSDAFYLPANSELNFKNTRNHSLSTGQRARAALMEISSHLNRPSILLLDEWDANLDPLSREELMDHLLALSNDHLIIDTRHR